MRSDAGQQFDGFAQAHFIRQNAAADLQVRIMTAKVETFSLNATQNN